MKIDFCRRAIVLRIAVVLVGRPFRLRSPCMRAATAPGRGARRVRASGDAQAARREGDRGGRRAGRDTGAIRVAHCRVAGVIGTEIRFSLLLPDEWNRKFMMGGGGGFVCRIDNQAPACS